MTARGAIGLALMLLAPAQAAWSATCTASATGMAFGNYQPLAGTTATTTATVTVTCLPGAISVLESYSIQIGGGTGGSVATRRMNGAGSLLAYQIYTDAPHTQIWGDGSAGSVVVSDSYLLGIVVPVTRNYTAYGIIPANLRVGIGAYTDTVIVTVTY